MTSIRNAIANARRDGDYAGAMDLFPYARFLGIAFSEEDGELLFRLPFSERNIGNPVMPALHGGVIGAFMEHAAIMHLLWNLESAVQPKVVDFSIDYLRPGRPEQTYAVCKVVRQGQRVANVSVETWQSRRKQVIATARGHFLLSRQDDLTPQAGNS
ncbi:MAG: PaaI family thioesterase [Ectothiorhodospiraceae bacterium]|nr:PaaI family thioesterase [Ectothiorhodospiraceae bacterium]